MDNSFIRFLNNFNEANDLGNSDLSVLNYNDQIHLHPNEDYSCISNNPNSINFDNLYKVYIVDCYNNVLANISDNAFISEFTSNIDGVRQIKFEVININKDFITDLVYFRIDHDILNGQSFWSNPFLISLYDIEETTKFRFKHYNNLDGTCYEVANIFQSIRLKCYKDRNSFANSMQSYTTIEGLKYSSRLIKTKFYNYIFDRCNDFIYDRLQYLLSHDIIYVNGIRVTDKQTFDSNEKFDNTTNVTDYKFKLAVDENDVYNYPFQIFDAGDELSVVSKLPNTVSTLLAFNTDTNNGSEFKIEFNKNITISGDISIRLYKNGLLIDTIYIDKITVEDNNLIFDFSNITFIDDNIYTIEIDGNKVVAVSEFWSGYSGDNFKFSLVSGYYNSDFYNSKYNTI